MRMVNTADFLLIQHRMVKALQGQPMDSMDQRLKAYADVGISLDELTSEEIEDADREALSIYLLKRFL